MQVFFMTFFVIVVLIGTAVCLLAVINYDNWIDPTARARAEVEYMMRYGVIVDNVYHNFFTWINSDEIGEFSKSLDEQPVMEELEEPVVLAGGRHRLVP